MIKILLVEDDKIIVASLSEYLNSEGYLVRSVSGQTAAMKLLAEEKADLVLLDVSLAEGNGFATITRACLKKTFCKMCVTICGIFCPDEGAVVGYGN